MTLADDAGTETVDFESMIRLSQLADYIIPFAIRVTADLGVADQLAGGPRPVAELAAATGADPDALYRVLRALASRDIFAEPSPGQFALSPMADLLRTDHPQSMRDSYPLIAADVQAWAAFDHTVRTGQNAFEHVHGMSYWSYIDAHPDYRERFDATMRTLTSMELHAILPRYDWGSFGTIVDVGGGTGGLVAGLLAAHPGTSGVVFDLPTVIGGTETLLAASTVADRARAVAGSFFDQIPPGGDAYLLKRILYSWDDTDAIRILRAVRSAMSEESRLIILEPVRRNGGRADLTAVLDLLNLAIDQGHTRNRAELAALCSAAGLRLTRMIPTAVFPITVAEPV